jgi:hypothetical protein
METTMRKILSALILAASLPAFADPVTLMSASTATGPSTAVHSTHIGTAGGTDVWTFNLSAFSRRAQLQESLDGVNWSTVALFLGIPIVRVECGSCHFRVYLVGQTTPPTPLTATAAVTGASVAATE